jgi:hypothetical protein
MNHHTEVCSYGFQNKLPALAKNWIANGHNASIGGRRSFMEGQGQDVQSPTKGTEHGSAVNELISGRAVVEETEDNIDLCSDGISKRASKAAGSANQPTMWHQLLDATAKGTATR